MSAYEIGIEYKKKVEEIEEKQGKLDEIVASIEAGSDEYSHYDRQAVERELDALEDEARRLGRAWIEDSSIEYAEENGLDADDEGPDFASGFEVFCRDGEIPYYVARR